MAKEPVVPIPETQTTRTTILRRLMFSTIGRAAEVTIMEVVKPRTRHLQLQANTSHRMNIIAEAGDA